MIGILKFGVEWTQSGNILMGWLYTGVTFYWGDFILEAFGDIDDPHIGHNAQCIHLGKAWDKFFSQEIQASCIICYMYI